MSEIKIEIEGNAQYATIKKLSSSDANGEPIGKETILDLLKKSNIIYGIDEKVIEFYVNAALQSEKPLLDIVVASRTTPLDLGSNYPKLNFEAPYSIDDAVVWNMFDNYFSDFRFDKYYNFPYKLKYAKKGDVLAHLLNSKKKVVGKNIKGKEISSKQVQNEYYAGENVHYDEKRKAFIAGAEGFLLYKNGTFSIKRPYFPTSDRMQLFALNLPTIKEFEITNNDILLFCKQKKIIRNILPNREQIKEKNNHILVIEGKQVVNGKDGELELFYSTEKSVGKVDENGKIDFKEKDHFKNTEEGDKLAIKTHPVEGSPGKDIYDNLIKPKPVKDINYRSGPGTRKEEQEDKFIVYSMTDGVIEFDDSYVSVSPKVMIMGDIDYSSGNINTKANVEIKGTVKAGFKVISSRDIIIKGDVE
ncbi:MAG: flagellar assembly protein A, partial [Candidatus Cloacimonadota bacterium]|nr:flagellar assembly protein A [Candidatus Cloacimonadota bacterium]